MDDREGVGRVIGGGGEHPAIVDLQHCRIAVAAKASLAEVRGDQRAPLDAAWLRRRGISAEPGCSRAEIAGKLIEEQQIVGMFSARDAISALSPFGVRDREASGPIHSVRRDA